MGSSGQGKGVGSQFPLIWEATGFMESEVWRLGSSGVRRSGVSEAPFGSLFFYGILGSACLFGFLQSFDFLWLGGFSVVFGFYGSLVSYVVSCLMLACFLMLSLVCCGSLGSYGTLVSYGCLVSYCSSVSCGRFLVVI